MNDDADCAQIVEWVENWLERREPDYDPGAKWIGDDWRCGRSGMHRSRIYDMASEALPPFVLAGAGRHWDREDI